jgi:protein-S-isoprenylcysteine O-methyltransferase Ste14
MPWVRAVIFVVLIPGTVAVYVPQALRGDAPLRGGGWQSGWVLIAAGVASLLAGVRSFFEAGGTPAIFFTRHLRAIWGEEPRSLVRSGLYRYSRNPMYFGVLAAIFGQAIVFGSGSVALYGLCLTLFFHLIVTLVEEPHLRSRDPEAFARYAAEVPRWFGFKKSQRSFPAKG